MMPKGFEEWWTDIGRNNLVNGYEQARYAWHSRDVEVANLQAQLYRANETIRIQIESRGSDLAKILELSSQLAASREMGPCPKDVESLSAKFHDLYQQEAKRQSDVRHKDAYADLPENIKEFDRVLARYVLAELAEVRQAAEEAGYRDGHFDGGRRVPLAAEEGNALSRVIAKAVRAEAEWWVKELNGFKSMGTVTKAMKDRLTALEAGGSQPGRGESREEFERDRFGTAGPISK
jgi:hypothetical protein